MTRLTEKIPKDELDDFDYDHYKTMYKDECLYKLGQYEDIEEWCERIEKGETVYRKLDNGKIFTYNDYNSTCDITYNFSKRSIALHHYLGTSYLEIDEYGKTWAFIKEELEK